MDSDVISIAENLGTTAAKLYMLSNNYSPRNKRHGSRYANYHKVTIKKPGSHKSRTLHVPNGFLKMIQRRILDKYLYTLEVSEFSTAYRKGTNLLDNALPHVGKECVLKLDISDFFGSIDDDAVYLAMKGLGLSVPATALLTHLCTYHGILPQGAPTSPYIANLVMRNFDGKLGKFCISRNIAYTRYCDDMTFSGSREDILMAKLPGKVKAMLAARNFILNDSKTVLVYASRQQRVTGIVVNEKTTVPRSSRREIRQQVYYCRKFGAQDCIRRKGLDITPEKYLSGLLGRITFALQTDPENKQMQEHFRTVREMIGKLT